MSIAREEPETETGSAPRSHAALRAPATPAMAIASVIVSMALVAVGNGLMFAYIPVRLGAEGFAADLGRRHPHRPFGRRHRRLPADRAAGAARSAMRAAFMILSALIVLSNAAIGAGTYPLLWIAARALYGFAICAPVHRRAELAERCRRAMPSAAGSWRSSTSAMSSGSAAARCCSASVDIDHAEAPLVGIVFTALSILPVGMTRLAQPPPPEGAIDGARAGPGASRRSASPACWRSAACR